eukprot:COSAG02_NODE_22885_length_737_cov_0.721003_2_plen_68_part_00
MCRTTPLPLHMEQPGHQKQQHQPLAQSHISASFLEQGIVNFVWFWSLFLRLKLCVAHQSSAQSNWKK